MSDLVWRDALEQAEAIRAGAVSAGELLDVYLDRIDALDERLRAFVTVDRAGAKAAAAEVDVRRRDDPAALGPFAGVPMSIKDTADVAGLPTTESCAVLADRIAEADGPIVGRIRRSGAIMLGKSNVPEFCTSITNSRLNGVCRNPWDASRTAGGSSGGAAAALAAGLCGISHGTDGAGSVRTPASWCGLVGLKPSRGLVSFGPEVDHPSYSTSGPGILARSVRDTAAMLDVFAPAGPWTPARPHDFLAEIERPPGRLRIGLCASFPVGEVEPEVASAVQVAGRLGEDLGHAVAPAEPAWGAMLAVAMLPMSAPHMAKHVSLAEVDRLEPRNQDSLRGELALTVVEHYRRIEATRAARREFLRLWEDVDVLITPVAGVVAPPVEWAPWDQSPLEHRKRFGDFANFAIAFNLSGQPAITLPLAWTAGGLPIGVQLDGPAGEAGVPRRLSPSRCCGASRAGRPARRAAGRPAGGAEPSSPLRRRRRRS